MDQLVSRSIVPETLLPSCVLQTESKWISVGGETDSTHICSLTVLPITSMIFVPNSTPIVCGESATTKGNEAIGGLLELVHLASTNWCNRQLFPTPMSPELVNVSTSEREITYL